LPSTSRAEDCFRIPQIELIVGGRPAEPELSSVETQVSHAAQVKEHALASIDQTKEHLFANGAPRHDAGSLHVQMRLGKALRCTAVRALSLCSRNIHDKYSAQFTGGCVAVKVFIGL